ncbi:MAG TPA: serine/threonine-protein kinase [Polyangia bacterium]|nr:serine/threonine-protein kinase [Polyangia bacterium]
MGAVQCPRCQRQYDPPVRVCAVDGTALVLAPVDKTIEDTVEGVEVLPAASLEEERLGGYRLLRMLGEGGMARVYLAEHEKLGRLCAVKRLHAAHFEDHVTVSRFLAEARAVSGIRHPNLVGIYDIIEEPEEICLVMEYLEGQDLGQILREQGPFYPPRAAALCAQACEGLEAVHARGIVHRDLKPDNLFLAREPDGQERVKLLDFGVARLVEDRPRALRTQSGQTVGTPQYMSPEQATASPIDPRSDIYMMGVVLFELVTGRTPFVGKGYGDVMMKHVHNKPPRPSDLRPNVPAWIDDIILRCLEKDPAKRFQSARELAAELRREATVRVTMPVEQLVVRRAWSNRTLVFMLAGALAIGMAVAVWLVVRFTGARPAVPPTGEPAVAVHGKGAAEGANVRADARSSADTEEEEPSEPAKPPVVRLKVVTLPPGAAVQVDGDLRCLGPCEVELQGGVERPVEVRVSAPGYATERRLIDIASPPPELRIPLRRSSHSSH